MAACTKELVMLLGGMGYSIIHNILHPKIGLKKKNPDILNPNIQGNFASLDPLIGLPFYRWIKPQRRY
jgi:hypothetical protein